MPRDRQLVGACPAVARATASELFARIDDEAGAARAALREPREQILWSAELVEASTLLARLPLPLNARVSRLYCVPDFIVDDSRLGHGFQYAAATQLGVLTPDSGFIKHNWVPVMNTPVFWDATELETSKSAVQTGDFVFGAVPGTKISIGGPLVDAMDHHTAILGVTGTGKTELAFDMIRHVLQAGVKVVAIDLTARYRNRISDLEPTDLSISAALATELSKKLFEAETGAYGAGKEKQALKAFADKLRDDVSKQLEAFLTSSDAKCRIGLITLDEISNTKATLFITELYLTCLLHFAREHSSKWPRV